VGLDREIGASRSRTNCGSGVGLLIGLALMTVAAGCSATQATPVTTASSGPVTVTSSQTIQASTTAAPTPTTDPALFAADPRLEACGGLEAGVAQVVALDHGWAYRAVMPGIGFVPQLDASSDPTLLVVYSGSIPARLDWRTYVHPPGPVPTTASTPTPAPPPGTKNVCLARNASDPPQLVPDATLQPFHPELASLAIRPSTQPGEGRVLTRNKQSTYSLAWDPIHSALWYTVQFSQTDSALYRLDPATGQTQRWALPATDYNGFLDMVVVDTTGAVWFDQSGIRLYRLDPASGKLAHLDIDTSIKPVVDQGGVYITAIAADGDGVWIARSSLPYLTRIDAGLHEVAKVQLPINYAGTNEVAAVGDLLAVGGAPDNFALFTREGQQVAPLPIQRGGVGLGPSRLLAAGPGRAAAVGNGQLDVFDATGRIVGTVPLKLDLPLGPFEDIGLSMGTAMPQAFTTDWNGTFWYALGTFIVEVRST
jgi:hypothetical protein